MYDPNIDLSIKWQLTVHLLIRHNVISTYIVYLVYCITKSASVSLIEFYQIVFIKLRLLRLKGHPLYRN